MGILKLKNENLDKKTSTIKEVLEYFSSKEEDFSKDVIEGIAAAADNAYTDDILFEEFENWADDKDDESFLYLIKHYWESKDKPSLDVGERDLTGNETEISKIKEASKQEVAQKFADFLNRVSTERNLTTLEALGKFLGVSTQRAAVLLDGKHKPQRNTIIKISEKFEIPIDHIFREIM